MIRVGAGVKGQSPGRRRNARSSGRQAVTRLLGGKQNRAADRGHEIFRGLGRIVRAIRQQSSCAQSPATEISVAGVVLRRRVWPKRFDRCRKKCRASYGGASNRTTRCGKEVSKEIFVAPESAPGDGCRVRTCARFADRGLEGDRFFRDSWNAVNRSDKAVSLIEDEVLELAAQGTWRRIDRSEFSPGAILSPGACR